MYVQVKKKKDFISTHNKQHCKETYIGEDDPGFSHQVVAAAVCNKPCCQESSFHHPSIPIPCHGPNLPRTVEFQVTPLTALSVVTEWQEPAAAVLSGSTSSN